MPAGALLKTKDGEVSKVLLESPFLSYDAYEPVTPKPAKTKIYNSLDRTWIDVVLLLCLIAGALFGLYALLQKAGCLSEYKAKAKRILRRHHPGSPGGGSDDELYARLQSERNGASELSTVRRAHANAARLPAAPASQPAPDPRDEVKESSSAFV